MGIRRNGLAFVVLFGLGGVGHTAFGQAEAEALPKPPSQERKPRRLVVTPPDSASPGRKPAVLLRAEDLPFDTTPKATRARRPPIPPVMEDGMRRLGDVKVLDLREGEGVFRVDGVEVTLRAGDKLKTDLVEFVCPDRLVLRRPATVDEKKGETVIIIEFVGPGRSSVQEYASRSWTAKPKQPVE
jgi:hypothetical protein